MGRRVCVIGWYNCGNIGDESFKESFRLLWPNNDYSFFNHVPANVNSYDVVFVGGGSLQPFPKDLDKITQPLGFIGVTLGSTNGIETLNKAKLVVVRDSYSKKFFPKALVAADLTMAQQAPKHAPKKKCITVLGNDFFTPRREALEWQYLSYNWFLQEFASVCDKLVEGGYWVQFLPMGINPSIDDRRFASAILGKMNKPGKAFWQLENISDTTLKNEIAISTVVLTQRFHGIVYSFLSGTPCVVIRASDKMAALANEAKVPSLNYYGFTKEIFWATFNKVLGQKTFASEYVKQAKQKWKDISAIVEKTFFS